MTSPIDQGEALAALAAKLTKAQLAVIAALELNVVPYPPRTLAGIARWESRSWPYRFPAVRNNGCSIHPLVKLGLLEARDGVSGTQAGRAWHVEPTPLGLALREHIQTNMEGER